MTTPFIGFGNDTLAKLPQAKSGDEIRCRKCGGLHTLEMGTDKRGNPSDVILFYKCGEEIYVGAIAGRLIVDVEPDLQGTT